MWQELNTAFLCKKCELHDVQDMMGVGQYIQMMGKDFLYIIYLCFMCVDNLQHVITLIEVARFFNALLLKPSFWELIENCA